jgi:hypothetical protein
MDIAFDFYALLFFAWGGGARAPGAALPTRTHAEPAARSPKTEGRAL